MCLYVFVCVFVENSHENLYLMEMNCVYTLFNVSKKKKRQEKKIRKEAYV